MIDVRALVAPWCAPDALGDAIRGALDCDRVAPAFLGGYRAAIAALVPGIGPASLAATEEGPLHPRRVQTRLTDGRLFGHKRYVTGVPGAERLVVLAVSAEHGDRRELVAAVVRVDGPGVRVHPMPATPFVPEVPHAEVTLDGAPAESVVPGDGWAEVVRPFRTVEDVHVMAAVHGYLLGASERARFGRDTVAALTGTLAALSAIGRCDPREPAVHVALAGVLALFRSTIDGLRWNAEPEEAARWARDLPLLSVAERARGARLQRAWDT